MSETFEYYRSKGLDEKAATYFASGRKQIVSVTPNDDFTLTLGFDNGEYRLLDMQPLCKKGTIFESLAHIENFKRVYLDEQHSIAWDIDPNIDSNTVWSNKIDLCSDSCYIDSIAL